VFTPEEWTDPQQFYRGLERVGAPRGEILDADHSARKPHRTAP
jgi:hypothetical protein